MSIDIASMFSQALKQVTDPYERQARLIPPLLALMPPAVMLIALYNDKATLLSVILWAFIACGLLFFLSDAARRLGKSREQALWKKWGGTPTTQVLRHSDDSFDEVSKNRYHTILATALGMPFPTAQDEQAAPTKADAMYASACNMLRNATRDTKVFSLLFKDNISYGFRRNGYGLRWLGMGSSVLCIAWVFVRQGIHTSMSRISDAPNIEAFFSGEDGISLLVSFVMLLIWATYFTESTLRDAAFSYAKKLIESCETTQIQKIKKKTTTV